MTTRHYGELEKAQWAQKKFACVGLDPELEKIPQALLRTSARIRDVLVNFVCAAVDATKHLAWGYKPNSAFYERHGPEGMSALRIITDYIHTHAPEKPVLLDGKRGDIGKSNGGYWEAAEFYGADAMTVHPLLGKESLQDLLDKPEKGIFVLCRTSNKGAGEFQGLKVLSRWLTEGFLPFYQHVAYQVSRVWNDNKNCRLVAGATYPAEVGEIRKIVGDMGLLFPGFGNQGGDLKQVLAVGKNSIREGFIANSSGGIMHPPGDDHAAALLEFHTNITACLKV